MSKPLIKMMGMMKMIRIWIQPRLIPLSLSGFRLLRMAEEVGIHFKKVDSNTADVSGRGRVFRFAAFCNYPHILSGKQLVLLSSHN